MNKLLTSTLLGLTLYSLTNVYFINLMTRLYFRKAEQFIDKMNSANIHLYIIAYNIIYTLLITINVFLSFTISYFFYEFLAK